MGKTVDRNTFWSIEKNPLSKEGVYMYSGRMIGLPGLEPDKLYPVYRPASELERAAESFEDIPFFEDHEMVGENTHTKYDDKPAQGVVGRTFFDGGMLKGNLKIFSEKLKDAIKRGKKELSLGYRCEYERRSGDFMGKAYEFIQKNLIGNHLALVDEGRMGSEVRVYDSFAFDSAEIEIENLKEEKTMAKTKDQKGDKPASDEFVDVAKLLEKFPNDKEWIEANKYTRKSEGKDAKDENVDKRKLIDEIGGILKGKLSEEEWRTVIGKAEKLSYNGSESSKADDEDEPKKDDKKGEGKEDKPKDAEPKKDEPKKGEDEDPDKKQSQSMDAQEKSLKARFVMGENFAKIIEEDHGTFDHSDMTLREIADYGCKVLGLDSIEGDSVSKMQIYGKTRKNASERYGLDSAQKQSKNSGVNKGIEDYLK